MNKTSVFAACLLTLCFGCADHYYRTQEDGVRMMIIDTESDNEEAVKFFQGIGYSSQKMHVWMTKVLHKGRGKPSADKGIRH